MTFCHSNDIRTSYKENIEQNQRTEYIPGLNINSKY